MDHVPSLVDELLLGVRHDAGWGWKLLKEGEEPIAARVAGEASNLRKIER